MNPSMNPRVSCTTVFRDQVSIDSRSSQPIAQQVPARELWAGTITSWVTWWPRFPNCESHGWCMNSRAGEPMKVVSPRCWDRVYHDDFITDMLVRNWTWPVNFSWQMPRISMNSNSSASHRSPPWPPSFTCSLWIMVPPLNNAWGEIVCSTWRRGCGFYASEAWWGWTPSHLCSLTKYNLCHDIDITDHFLYLFKFVIWLMIGNDETYHIGWLTIQCLGTLWLDMVSNSMRGNFMLSTHFMLSSN